MGSEKRDAALVFFKEFMRDNGAGSSWDGPFLNVWWFDSDFHEVFVLVRDGCLELKYLADNAIVRFDLCDPNCFDDALDWIKKQVDDSTAFWLGEAS